MRDLNQVKEIMRDLSILYVEDDDVIRRELSSLLKKFCEKVTTATNGKEALDVIEKIGKFDILITDINMPILNGIELIKILNDQNRDERVVVTTAHSDLKYLTQLLNQGIDKFLLKPFELEDIIDVIYKVGKSIKDKKDLEYLKLQNIKFSSTLELFHAISHHWRQPLFVITLISGDIADSIKDEEIDKEYIVSSMQKIIQESNKLSSIIDKFKDIYRFNDNKENFLVGRSILDLKTILEPSFLDYEIIFDIDIKDDFEIFGNSDELMFVIQSVLINSKEALIAQNVENKYVNIKVHKKDNNAYIDILDNAGGVSKEIEEKIFEPYFSTKSKLNDTGMGLYISKKVIEKNFNAKIIAKNFDCGLLVSLQFLL